MTTQHKFVELQLYPERYHISENEAGNDQNNGEIYTGRAKSW